MLDHHKRIEDLTKNNRIFIFMKGNPETPMCGFSALAVNILKNLKAPFESFDVLKDPEMRQAIKDYTDWPTIPQIFIDGNFLGGSDILEELYKNGELKKLLKISE